MLKNYSKQKIMSDIIKTNTEVSNLFIEEEKDPHWVWVGISAQGQAVSVAMVNDIKNTPHNPLKGVYEYSPGQFWNAEWFEGGVSDYTVMRNGSMATVQRASRGWLARREAERRSWRRL